MKTKFIEAVSDFNWGKFMVAQFTEEEWERRSAHPVDHQPLLKHRGWTNQHIIVFDIQTGEGGIFRATPTACPAYDLNEHRIWVCPMFEPFLCWLYRQDLADLDKLPNLIAIPPEIAKEHAAFRGYRRPGPAEG